MSRSHTSGRVALVLSAAVLVLTSTGCSRLIAGHIVDPGGRKFAQDTAGTLEKEEDMGACLVAAYLVIDKAGDAITQNARSDKRTRLQTLD